MEDRRKYPRVETLNFIYYVIQDDGETITKDMGRTLDASERGLLIETHIPLVEGLRLKMDIGLGNAILELSGDVVHSRETPEGLFHSGIELDPMDNETQQQYLSYIERFETADHA